MVVLVRGPVDDATGFAEVVRGIALNLQRLGITVRLQPLAWGSAPAQISPEDVRALAAMKECSLKPDVVITVGIPPSYARWGNAAAIGLGMLEVDRAPRQWAAHCNNMDEIWVPSRFSLDAFVRGGVRKDRIRIVPLGVDTVTFTSAPHPDSLSDRPYTFLSVSEWVPRKGFDTLVRAYVEEFSGSESVRLVIRSHSNGPDYDATGETIRSEIGRLVESCGKKNPPSITFIPGVIPKPSMPGLYRASDCFVLPTRGEGWNLTALEAAACGVPVITTAWSSHLDVLTGNNSYLINVKSLEAVPLTGGPHDEVYKGSQWACPDPEHLRILMRRVYGNREEARQKAAGALATISGQFSWEASARRMVLNLNQVAARKDPGPVADGPGPEPPVSGTRMLPKPSVALVVPSWGERCGIAEYAAHLSQGLAQVGCRVSVIRGAIEELGQVLPPAPGNIVHIQYEYSLFNHERFKRLYAALADRGLRSVLTLHSFTPGAREQNEFLKERRCPLVVHSVGMQRTLRAEGWENPIEVIPMGVTQFNLDTPAGRQGTAEEGPSIGFTGFMHWYKGLVPLIEAVSRLRRLLPNARCHVFSCVSENPGSQAFYRYFLEYVKTGQLEDVVSLHMGWRSEEDIVRSLREMDVNVLPYTDCGYVSSSAAVRMALSAGRPLITSDSAFFDDLSDEVLKVPAGDTEAILDAIILAVTDAGQADELVSRASAFAARNTWTEVSRRHLALYRSLAAVNAPADAASSASSGEGER